MPRHDERTISLLTVAALLLVLVTAATFAGVRHNGFVNWDDDVYILENARIQALTWANLRWMLTTTAPWYWHPLTWLAHAVDHRLWGLDAAGHHLTSVLLHAGNAVLVLVLFVVLVSRVRRDRSPVALAVAGFLAAAAFAVHPLRVESVAWAAEKKDLLCAFFCLATILAHCRSVDPGGRLQLRPYVLTHLLFVLALMSKPMAVTLPAVLLLLDVHPLGRVRRLRDVGPALLRLVPMLALAAGVALLTLGTTSRTGALVAAGRIDVGGRLLLALRGITFYLERTLWPHDLVPLYPLYVPAFEPADLLRLGVLGGVSAAGVALWLRGERPLLTAWACFLVTIAPVSGVLQAGGQAAADRFTYLPSLGFYLLLGAALLRLREWHRGLFGPGSVAALVVVAMLAGATTRQVEIWRDSETMWRRVAATFPGQAPQAHNNLGAIYHQRGDLARAREEYEETIRIHPTHANAYNNLGVIHMAAGNWRAAVAAFQQALRLEPGHPKAMANLARLVAQHGVPRPPGGTPPGGEDQ